MSQYPSPYQTPPAPQGYPGYYYQDPLSAGLAPCRRAGILMIVVGVLALLAGGCLVAAFNSVPLEQVLAQQGMTLPPGATVEQLRREVTGWGTAVGVVGILFVVLAFFVRRGSRGPSVAATVLTGLSIGVCLLNVVSALIVGRGGQAVQAVCLMIVPIGLLVFQFAWLIQSMRAAHAVRQWQVQSGGYPPSPYYPQTQPGGWPPVGAWPGQPPQPPPYGWPGQQPPPPPPPSQQNWPPPPPPPSNPV